MVNYRQLIINCNRVVDLCIKYNVKWLMTEAGITIYYSDSETGIWFPIANANKAIPLIMQIANVTNTSQSTLDRYL